MARRPTTGSWLWFFLFVVLACVPSVYMAWFWFVEQERGRQSESWPAVDGVFERAGVKGGSESTRHASYRYTVDGKTYQGYRAGFAYKEAPPIDPGAAVKVYVDPADPTMSVLVPGESDKRWPLGVGVGLTVFLALFAAARWPVMSPTYSSRRSSWLPFLVSSGVLLGACAILGLWALEQLRGRDSLSWPSVAGVMKYPGGKSTDVEYWYEVDGRRYRGDRVRFAWTRKNGYDREQEIRVFVNPADPKDAVLYPGTNWAFGIPLFVAAWAVIAGFLTWASWPPWETESRTSA